MKIFKVSHFVFGNADETITSIGAALHGDWLCVVRGPHHVVEYLVDVQVLAFLFGLGRVVGDDIFQCSSSDRSVIDFVGDEKYFLRQFLSTEFVDEQTCVGHDEAVVSKDPAEMLPERTFSRALGAGEDGHDGELLARIFHAVGHPFPDPLEDAFVAATEDVFQMEYDVLELQLGRQCSKGGDEGRRKTGGNECVGFLIIKNVFVETSPVIENEFFSSVDDDIVESWPEVWVEFERVEIASSRTGLPYFAHLQGDRFLERFLIDAFVVHLHVFDPVTKMERGEDLVHDFLRDDGPMGQSLIERRGLKFQYVESRSGDVRHVASERAVESVDYPLCDLVDIVLNFESFGVGHDEFFPPFG